MKACQSIEDPLSQSKWIANVNKIAIRLVETGHPHLGILPDCKYLPLSLLI